MKSRLILNRHYTIGEVDNRIYSGFIEHLGRAVYEGIYQPGHPSADEDGFRTDVLELIRGLDMPLTRYPGGNFVSGYNWEDGVGPRGKRPVRLDLAWKALEPNTFGTDEFMKWCRKAGTAPMMAVNLGTRGAADAQRLVEYCNFPAGTELSDRRRANGSEAPYGVKLWCLGNEMDGPWQTGQRSADDYGRTAREAAKMMKWTDPSIELVVCGSSSGAMPTFGSWEETVLGHTCDLVDYLSIHQYFGNRCGCTPGYLARAEAMDEFISRIAACCDAVGAKKKSGKKIMLSFDEWNVWFHSNGDESKSPEWTVARPLLEDIYTMEDALLVGLLLMTLLNHADRVKIACIAQSVNVIAPVMTEKEGKAWRQTIYHPFALTSKYGRGTTLRVVVDSPCYDAEFRHDRNAPPEPCREIPYLYTAAVHNEERGEIAIFAANRSLAEPMELEAVLQDFGAESVIEHKTLHHKDLNAVNSAREEAVKPEALSGARLDGDALSALLPAASWNMIRIRLKEPPAASR
ncbi:MAG: alpha-N-arabinofuranosidase [Lentisphaeria bacterium]|nr:alpha-N-arabinofuranosidase [Lentisphaeria bacterium]